MANRALDFLLSGSFQTKRTWADWEMVGANGLEPLTLSV